MNSSLWQRFPSCIAEIRHISLIKVTNCMSCTYQNWKTRHIKLRTYPLVSTVSDPLFPTRCPRVSVCCPGCCLSMTQTSWLMPAGHSPTYLMDPMTKSRLSLTPESAAGWWNCWCKAYATEAEFSLCHFDFFPKSCFLSLELTSNSNCPINGIFT